MQQTPQPSPLQQVQYQNQTPQPMQLPQQMYPPQPSHRTQPTQPAPLVMRAQQLQPVQQFPPPQLMQQPQQLQPRQHTQQRQPRHPVNQLQPWQQNFQLQQNYVQPQQMQPSSQVMPPQHMRPQQYAQPSPQLQPPQQWQPTQQVAPSQPTQPAQQNRASLQQSTNLPFGFTVTTQRFSTEGKVLQARPRALMKLLSIAQLVLGVITVAFGLTLILVDGTPISNSSYGIWCGVLHVVVGVFGIASVQSNASKWIRSAMILNIINAALFIPSLLVLSAVAIKVSSETVYICRPSSHCRYSSEATTSLILNSLMLIISVVELVLSAGMIFLCREAVGCCSLSQQHNQAQYTRLTPHLHVTTQQMITTYQADPTASETLHQQPMDGRIAHPLNPPTPLNAASMVQNQNAGSENVTHRPTLPTPSEDASTNQTQNSGSEEQLITFDTNNDK